MSWAKLDDAMPDHPKIIEAGPLAGWLYICGLCYCARLLTDGKIARKQVRKLADIDDPMALANRLVEVGLWENDGMDFVIHDYLKYNPTRENALSIRESRSESGRVGGLKSGEARSKQIASGLLEAKPNPVPVPVPVPVPKDSSSLRSEGRFAPPVLAEVVDHFTSEGSTAVAASRFWHYYEANGWRVGRTLMKKWKSAAAGWMLRDRDSKNGHSRTLADRAVEIEQELYGEVT